MPHVQSVICTQLFAGELTNQNWEYFKVNDNKELLDDWVQKLCCYTFQGKNKRSEHTKSLRLVPAWVLLCFSRVDEYHLLLDCQAHSNKHTSKRVKRRKCIMLFTLCKHCSNDDNPVSSEISRGQNVSARAMTNIGVRTLCSPTQRLWWDGVWVRL